MFHAITGLIALYVIWRLVWRLRVGAPVKRMLAVSLLLVSQHHLITRTFFGTMASPEVPAFVLMLLGWAFGALLISAFLLLAVDLLGVLGRFLSQSVGNVLLNNMVLRGGIAAVAMGLAAIGVWEAAVRVPDVRTVEVELKQLPPALDGFRLVQLTDLHASRLLQRPWIEAVVAKTNALKPDLTVITGDLADGTVSARHDDMEPLRNLTAPQGVFAIVGNHEYYVEYSQWVQRLNALGLRMLLNEHVLISRDNAAFVLAGITDRTAADFKQQLPDTRAALEGISPNSAVVLLSHRPTGAKENARAGADLQLSGHTHGGQVLGMHWVTQLANEGYVSGSYDVDGMHLYVSNGAGLWNGFPIRLGKRAEITQFILRSPAL
ncbi:metallophosphoesterase [Pectobacterium wasabiae]|uniref:Metallophosphoesterase n=1 Tax=Pectobacterium wasabiae TaxID=55208 RepID=A0AAW3EFW9_9GAMM|nr:metallophosphoesterase [Pectobacterium wasabiae]AOR65658.1 metallophosphoesterase [Pectobacterium wasabiae CFBP 3304]EJS94153.1 Putative metallophosphoesterase [Pectobacterium wasabiae CFBP 3304]KFX05603.1 metallophosphoesterase [Pectobacterium wasabiae]KGA30457.1 metallophosphoesterase [Pectobacterium wasabiae]